MSKEQRKTGFRKHDLLVTVFVVLYLGLAVGAAQVWTFLSHQADAFATEAKTVRGR